MKMNLFPLLCERNKFIPAMFKWNIYSCSEPGCRNKFIPTTGMIR